MINTKDIALEIYPKERRPNKVIIWRDSDSEELYNENIKKFGSDWHYAKNNFSYTYNSLGYRGRELSVVEDRKFFIVYGCSHTEGVGLADYERWGDLLEGKMQLPSLNFGRGGSGPDLVHLNSLLFLKNAGKRPKFVVIQWPEITRTMYLSDSPALMLPTSKKSPELMNFYKEFLSGNNPYNRGLIHCLTTQLLWKLAGVPTFNFYLGPGWENVEGVNKFLPGVIDKSPHLQARDLIHHGLEMHTRITNWVYENIRDKF